MNETGKINDASDQINIAADAEDPEVDAGAFGPARGPQKYFRNSRHRSRDRYESLFSDSANDDTFSHGLNLDSIFVYELGH